MRMAFYYESPNAAQLILAPETEAERKLLATLNGKTAKCRQGDFIIEKCKGGWLRPYERAPGEGCLLLTIEAESAGAEDVAIGVAL